MNKQKWLGKEIENWVSEGLVTEETADKIKNSYDKKNSTNLMIIIFSIIGSILIGAGIILIFAKNWNSLPVWLRVATSFCPLIAAQGLCLFVLLKRNESIAWREGTSIFLTLTVFASIAMVGQIFHMPGDFGTYILTSALLSLPVIYILNASSPVIIYVWAILNWAALYSSIFDNILSIKILWLLLLISLIAPFIIVKIKGDKYGARGQIMAWVTALGGFFAVWFIYLDLFDYSGHLLSASFLLFFALIFVFDTVSYNDALSFLTRPFRIIGSLGILVILFIYSYSGLWEFSYEITWSNSFIPYIILGLAMLGLIIWLFLKSPKEKLGSIITLSPVVLSIALVIFTMLRLEKSFFPSILVNLCIFTIGLFVILKGIKETYIGYTNLGMILLCLLIVLRFFDWEMDFLSRGIAFVLLGIGFLMVNLYLVKKRKAVGA